jgi:hypothetical protein
VTAAETLACEEEGVARRVPLGSEMDMLNEKRCYNDVVVMIVECKGGARRSVQLGDAMMDTGWNKEHGFDAGINVLKAVDACRTPDAER